MKLSIFAASDLQRAALEKANACRGREHDIVFQAVRLSRGSSPLAQGSPTVCALSSDRLDAALLRELSASGVRNLLLPDDSVQFVDLVEAGRLNLRIGWISRTSPRAVAEYAIALILSLSRSLLGSTCRNAGTADAEPGFELPGKIAGIIGLGPVGLHVGGILRGLGCSVLGYDFAPRSATADRNMRLARLDEIYRSADIISLHCPLTAYTRRLMDSPAISQCRRGLTLISTGSVSLLDLPAVVRSLERGWLGAVGIDVNEEEADLAASGAAAEALAAALRPFPNAIVTGGRSGLSRESLLHFADSVLDQATGDVDRRPRRDTTCAA